MATSDPHAVPDPAAALRGRVLAAHADLDHAPAGSRPYRQRLEAVIAASDALLAEQERQVTAELQRRRRQALAVLRPVGGAAAAAMVVILVLASTGVVAGWWWLLALPVLFVALATLAARSAVLARLRRLL